MTVTQTQTTVPTTTIVMAPAVDLARALGNAALFVGPPERPILNSVRLEITEGASEAKFTATDSYGLAVDTVELSCEAVAAVDVLIPKDLAVSAVKLLKAAKGAQATVEISEDITMGGHAGYRIAIASLGQTVAGDCAYGDFPRTETLWPTTAMDLNAPVGFGAFQLARLAKVQAAGVKRNDPVPVVFTVLDPLKPAKVTIGDTFAAIVMPFRLGAR